MLFHDHEKEGANHLVPISSTTTRFDESVFNPSILITRVLDPPVRDRDEVDRTPFDLATTGRNNIERNYHQRQQG